MALWIQVLVRSLKFTTLCLNKVVLQNVLVGLYDARGDYLEKILYRFVSY